MEKKTSMNLNDIPKEFFANFTSVLDNVCGKGTWFIAGGFVRDHMLEKPQSDMDVFVGPVKGLTMSLLLAVLNSPNQPMTKHGHWFTKFEVDYLYDDEEHSKHIQFILDHSNYKIQVIVLDHYIDGSTNAIDKYVRNNFDCTLSMCWWSPNTGIAAVLKNKDSDLSFIEDAHNKRLRFKKSTTQAYMSKIIYKYKDYKIGVTPYE